MTDKVMKNGGIYTLCVDVNNIISRCLHKIEKLFEVLLKKGNLGRRLSKCQRKI